MRQIFYDDCGCPSLKCTGCPEGDSVFDVYLLLEHATGDSFEEKMEKAGYKNMDQTYTGKAIQKYYESTDLSNVTDSSRKKVLLVVTDGEATDDHEVIEESIKLWTAKGVYPIAIGVGNAKRRELISIASDPTASRIIDDWDKFRDVVQTVVVPKICNTPGFESPYLEGD